MGTISDFLENELVDHIFGNGAYTPPTTVYVGLSTADPTDSGSGLSEPVGNGYARVAISFDAAASRLLNQTSEISFPKATGSWGTITHYTLHDALTSGNLMGSSALTASKTIVSGKTPKIPAGTIDVSITSGAASDYLANTLLDFAFRNQSFSVPTLYVGWAETAIADATTGSTVDEPEMTGYARVAHSAWTTASGGATTNTGVINFGQWTGTGETMEANFIADSGTTGAGNILVYDNTPSFSVDSGDYVEIPDGDADVSID